MGVMVRQCAECGRPNAADAERCRHCGELLHAAPLVDADTLPPDVRNAGAAFPDRPEILDAASVVCPNCGHEGAPLSVRPGSTALELLLWLAGLLPGVIYSVWRATVARPVLCRRCAYPYVVPAGTPEARRIQERLGLVPHA